MNGLSAAGDKTAKSLAFSVAAALVGAPAAAMIAAPAASANPGCVPDPISLECVSNEPAPGPAGGDQLPPGIDANLPDLPSGPDVPGDAPENPQPAPGS